MKATKIKLKNFRSFGPNETIVKLQDDLTGIVGANSTGKTALLEALRKVFGPSQPERTISKTDFHIPCGTEPDEIEECEMYIEVVFEFESTVLESEEDDDGFDEGLDSGIPDFFEQMVVEETGRLPCLRIRLQSLWKKDPINPEGSIDTKLVFVTCPEEEEETDQHLQIFPNHKRSLVQSFYVPAIRRPSDQLKFASGSILFRLLKRIKWPENFKEEFRDKLDELNEHFDGVENFESIKDKLSSLWKDYNKDTRYNEASITFGSTDFDSILQKLEIEFTPTDTGRPFSISELGEGYRSLFYLTLVSTLLKIEDEFDIEVGEKPLLTLLLIEEPENHIAPQLLGRVLNNLKALSEQENVQVIMSSHTPSIISRIEPEAIRHLRLDEAKHRTIASSILLPKKTDEAYKYVKEAVRNFPEIYFSRLVVLGEGDSEEIIFNRISRVYDKGFDDHYISFAPLGGRHVNHIWKLLAQLNIPYVTLLDLDRERGGGGWGRIKYAIKQVIQNYPDKREALLRLQNNSILPDARLEIMHTWDTTKIVAMDSWISRLESYDIYFSYPLDLDFMMLKTYKKEYNKIAPEGPEIPDKVLAPDEFKEKLDSGIQATLKSTVATAETYSEEEKELMIWYKYHFLGRGKPSTHILALSEISNEDLLEKMPAVLQRIFEKISEKLS